MGKYARLEKFQRQLFQWVHIEGRELPEVTVLFNKLFEDLYREEGQCYEADSKAWDYLNKKWRKEWGPTTRVKAGCPLPVPNGLDDYKLWRVGTSHGVDYPMSQAGAFSGMCFPMTNGIRNLNAMEYPDIRGPNIEVNMGGPGRSGNLLDSNSAPFSNHTAVFEFDDNHFHEGRFQPLSDNSQLGSTAGLTSAQIHLDQQYPNTFNSSPFSNGPLPPPRALAYGYTPFQNSQYSGRISPEALEETRALTTGKATATLARSHRTYQNHLETGLMAQHSADPYYHEFKPHDPYLLLHDGTTTPYR